MYEHDAQDCGDAMDLGLVLGVDEAGEDQDDDGEEGNEGYED